MKSEPSVYGINHLKEEVSTLWDGIRNYQARNFMRSMKIGDKSFFYHSNTKPPCIVGLMEIIKTNIIDPTQFNPESKYYDPKSPKESPRWDCVEVKYIGQYKKPLTLEELTNLFTPEQLPVVKKGNRISVLPVPSKSAEEILRMLTITY